MAIKILIGGSPCTYWSIAQTNNRETKAEGMGWELFKNYLIAKEKFKPDFFLYENNKSASQAIKDQIAEEFGVGVDPNVKFTYINSALVSAQNRQRFYVTNFGDIEQPEDRGILLKDILETGYDLTSNDKSFVMTASYNGAVPWNTIERSQRTMVAEPIRIPEYGNEDKARPLNAHYSNNCGGFEHRMFNPNPAKQQVDMIAESVENITPFVEKKIDEIVGKYGYLPASFNPYNSSEITDKSPTLTTQCGSQTSSSSSVLTCQPLCIGEVPEHKGTYRNGKQPSQQYRVYDTNRKGVAVTTDAITNVAEPLNVTMPIQVGALPRPNGELSSSQAMRIYSDEGKSVTQSASGGGLGGKTGLYAIPISVGNMYPNQGQNGQLFSTEGKSKTLSAGTGKNGRGIGSNNSPKVLIPIDNPSYAIPVEWNDGIPTKAISCADGKTYTVHKVVDGIITIKEKEYPIKLKDGYYIIRKLTVRECARLQTMPDDYCKAVSDSQAYKALGNGWTAEVIIHLLNHALKDVPRDEEIVVLSMYDGIATGRYCLDKMGFTNVKYHAYEIDKYPIMVAMDNYPDIIQHGDAFAVREDDWQPPQTRSEWLDSLLGDPL